VFYRKGHDNSNVLLKCLLNGKEARLPLPTDNFPYYKWADFRQFYLNRCQSVPAEK
jgi:hypothetical protein